MAKQQSSILFTRCESSTSNPRADATTRVRPKANLFVAHVGVADYTEAERRGRAPRAFYVNHVSKFEQTLGSQVRQARPGQARPMGLDTGDLPGRIS